MPNDNQSHCTHFQHFRDIFVEKVVLEPKQKKKNEKMTTKWSTGL